MDFLVRFFTAKSRTKPLYLYNTLTKSKEEFSPSPYAKTVRMYNCGPTVYGPQHIGNLSMFVFTDILRRTLEWSGFSVKQVINFTDVGHLSSDADDGEDKMSLGLAREGLEPTLKNMRTLGEKYAEKFLADIQKLSVATDKTTFPRASDYLDAQIAMIKTLEEKGYAYRTSIGVYFDTSKFPPYGKLGDINLEGLKAGARIDINPEKKSPADFNLWKLDSRLGWDSPWGKGYPGWHIECSAMINATLGKQIDIHTGGIEHIPIHHNNEIAQSESVTGKHPLSRFWLHRAHVQIEGAKIAKSEGNTVFLDDVISRGFHPLALRYLFLTAHYRTASNFTWEALEAAQVSFLKLRRKVDSEKPGGIVPSSYLAAMEKRWGDDLDTPGALAILWDMLKDKNLSASDMRAGILAADAVFGLGFDKNDAEAKRLCTKMFGTPVSLEQVPERVQKRIHDRDEARKTKNWEFADAIRKEIESMGYTLEDTAEGVRVFKK